MLVKNKLTLFPRPVRVKRELNNVGGVKSPLEQALINESLARDKQSKKDEKKWSQSKPLRANVSSNKSSSDITKADKHPTKPPNGTGLSPDGER